MSESDRATTAGNEQVEPTEPAERDEGGTRPKDSAEPTGDGDLVASLWPWNREPSNADLEIVVYVVTGHHGPLRIPERYCRECHMFVHAADQAVEQVDSDVNVQVVSWWTHLPFALRHGGQHAPVLVVDGKRLCQGYDVPTPGEVVAAIEEALE
jgi:hypothetical protein